MVNFENATREAKRLYLSKTKGRTGIERMLEKGRLAEKRKGKKEGVPLGRKKDKDLTCGES
jgi:hypothetical protein